MIVADASVLLDVLLGAAEAPALERRIFGAGRPHAPALVDLEVAQVLRRHARQGDISADFGRRAIELFARFPVRRHAHVHMLGRVWALRDNLTAYDAAYVALAEGLGATLVTRDAALAGAAGHRATIELV